MINNIPQFVQITGSGTINLSREGSETIVSIQGGAALAAGLVIQLDGAETPQFGDTFIMYYQATCTQGGGGSMTIFSAVPNISEVWWGKPFMVTCFYNGSAWSSQIFVSADNSGWIETGDIKDKAVTALKMEDIADGSIFGGNAAGNAAKLIVAGVLTAAEAAGNLIFGFAAGAITNAAINAAAAIAWSKMAAIGSADIIVGDAFGVPTPVAMTGDVAIDNVGKTTIQPNAVTPSMLFVGGDLEAIVMDVSLETAFLSAAANSMIIPFKGEAIAIYVYVDDTSIGDATFTVYLAGVPVPTGAAVLIAAGSLVGTGVMQNLTAPNTFAANVRLNIGTSSTAAGGSCKVTVIVQKTL
tara:strand:- start:2986 stop:4050 length:1065 start_codon:yes stop_codon:yes gene_type:complete